MRCAAPCLAAVLTGHGQAVLCAPTFMVCTPAWQAASCLAGRLHAPNLVHASHTLLPCLAACRWLAAHGRLEQAQAVLRSLRSPEEADADVADLGELTRAEKAQPRQALAALLQEPEVQAELRLGKRGSVICIEPAAARGPGQPAAICMRYMYMSTGARLQLWVRGLSV